MKQPHASYATVAFAAVVACVPVWLSARLPTMDGPQHLLLAHMAARFDDPAYGYVRFFDRNPSHMPPTLGDLVLHGLFSAGVPAPTAQKLYVTLVIALLAAAVAYACAYRDARNTFFAAPVMLTVHGLALGMGFFEFLLSIPFGVAALGVALRGGGTGSLRRGLACAALLALSVLAHPFVCAALLPAFGLVAWGQRQRPVAAMLPLLPALGIAAALFLTQAGVAREITPTAWTPWVEGLGVLAFDGFRGVASTGLVGLLGALVVVGPGAVAAFRSRERLLLCLLALAGIYAVATVVLPGAAFNWALLQHRFVPLFWIAAVLVAAQAPLPYPRVLVGVSMLFLCAQSFLVARKYAVIDRGLADYVSGAEAIPRAARLLPLDFAPRGESEHWLIRPYLHAWAWPVMERGGMTPYVFATLPIHAYQFHDRPPAPPEFIDLSYSCAQHGIAGRTPECEAFHAGRLRAFAKLSDPYDAVLTWKAPAELRPLLEARGFRLAHQGAHSAVYVADRR